MKNEKICLIGYGYWGKILHKNLLQLNYQHIKIVDEVLENYHEITEDYDFYFVVTPFSTHEKILKRLANFSNKKIWSEKPLVKTLKASEEIYALLEENGNKLFVDWTYTFNPCVHYLKQILEKNNWD
jgi:predicted dehydrogenase